MKKILVTLVLGLISVLALASCGGSESSGSDVAVCYYNYADNYISTVRSALDKNLEDANISYTDYDGANNQGTQTDQTNTAIAKGAKLLIVNIVDTTSADSAQGIVDACKEKDIPVIFFNREVSNTAIDSYEKAAYVGTNAIEAGYLQGDMIGDYLVNNYDTVDINGDGKISYVMMKGQEGNKEADYRTQYGVENANIKLKAAGKPELEFYDSNNSKKYLLDDNGSWSAAQGTDKMSTVLAKYTIEDNNFVELAICNNDNMAEGVIAALNTKGYNTGVATDVNIPVFGVDATSAALKLISENKMTGTVKQDSSKMAKAIFDVTKNGLDGKDLMTGISDNYSVDDDCDKIRIAYSKVEA